MATERLYYADPTLTRFDARVIEHVERDGRWVVMLDRTAFYPEGGGQPPDRGALNGVAVLDVQTEGDDVWHTLGAPLAEGPVTGEVEWARRQDHMQQHHGQHLLSAAFENLFGLRTISFHLGPASSTIDLDTRDVTEHQLRAAESLANQVIWECRPVHARFVTPEELATIPLRKPPAVMTRVRVVSVADFDHSACGGTHPANTGGVGVLGVRRAERRGDETRIEFLCGTRVLGDLAVRGGIAQRAALALSVGVEELEDAVRRLAESEREARKRGDDAVREVLRRQAADHVAGAPRPGGIPLVALVLSDQTLDDVRFLAQEVAGQGGVGVLATTRDGKGQIVVARGDGIPLDAGALLRAAVTAAGGKGGGPPGMAQGGIPDASEARAVVAEIAGEVANRLAEG